MSGRVAALSFAACLVVAPGYCRVESTAFPAASAEPAVAALALHPENIPVGVAAVPADPAVSDGAPVFDGAAKSAVPTAIAVPVLASPGVQFASRDPTEPVVRPAGEPFGLATIRVADGDVVAKWRKLKADIGADTAVLARCRSGSESCPPAAQNFLGVIAQGRTLSGRARIGVINRAVNLAIAPMSDLKQWGEADRWSAPLETFSTGHGDCEDYAIAKYVALTEAGIAAADVKLVIVRNTAAHEDHAIVAVHLDGDWITLDNRWLRLVADRDFTAAVPLYVLDADGVRQFAAPPLPTERQASAPASL